MLSYLTPENVAGVAGDGVDEDGEFGLPPPHPTAMIVKTTAYARFSIATAPLERPVSAPVYITAHTGAERGESNPTNPAEDEGVSQDGEGRRTGLARGDIGAHAEADPGGRPRDDRRAQMDQGHEPVGRACVVPRRDRLHRGDVHEGREAHIRPRGQPPGPIASFQFQSGRPHAKGD